MFLYFGLYLFWPWQSDNKLAVKAFEIENNKIEEKLKDLGPARQSGIGQDRGQNNSY